MHGHMLTAPLPTSDLAPPERERGGNRPERGTWAHRRQTCHQAAAGELARQRPRPWSVDKCESRLSGEMFPEAAGAALKGESSNTDDVPAEGRILSAQKTCCGLPPSTSERDLIWKQSLQV